MNNKLYWRDQSIALSLTVVTFLILVGLVWTEIRLMNPVLSEHISLLIRPGDVLIGMTVYLKTAIDFAIFIGRLMDKNPGLKGRVAIEIGTALGNGLGTMAILLVWSFFREIDWLLGLMVVVAALVLLRLAQDSLDHTNKLPRSLKKPTHYFEQGLQAVNKLTHPVLSRVVPSQSIKIEHKKSFFALFAMSFTVPFILGLDDFAGYVPLFSIVNVFSFSIGVLLGHMVLNLALYVSPDRTTTAIKNPIIALVGSVAFVILAGWGLVEAIKLLVP